MYSDNYFTKLQKDLRGKGIIPPDTYPGRPPKYYKVKKAVSVFACFKRSFGFACYEVLRAKCVRKGKDIYVIHFPTAQKEKGIEFHESLHESGEIHLSMLGYKYPLLFGSKDIPAAFRLPHKLNPPLCLCFRKGRSLSKEDITRLVSRLVEYLPIGHEKETIEKIVKDLCKKDFCRFTLQI